MPRATRTFCNMEQLMRNSKSRLLLPIMCVVALGCDSEAVPGDDSAPVKSVRVVNTFPHDPTAFVQGLVVEGETLFEGTGRYGESSHG